MIVSTESVAVGVYPLDLARSTNATGKLASFSNSLRSWFSVDFVSILPFDSVGLLTGSSHKVKALRG